jgi:BlaI family transcriptional regulator, penicillinase repressor
MMFSTRKLGKPFSQLEQLVMEVIWERRCATAEQVRSALAKSHPMKESTVRTILSRLEDKGHVRHRVEGRTNVYSAVESAHSVAAKTVSQIIDRFCKGSVEQLLLGMVDDNVLDEDELRRLAQRIVRRKKSKKEA